MGLLTTEVPNQNYVTQNDVTYAENTTLLSIEPIEQRFYILIPFGAFLGIILISLLIYLMASNRRRLVHVHCKKRHDMHFSYEGNEYDSPLERDPNGVEEEEDEVDNGDNPAKSLLRGKLQINRYENYLSTSQLIRSSELFT